MTNQKTSQTVGTECEETFIDLLKNGVQWDKFLPTATEVEKMYEIEFADWIEVAIHEIPQRRIARDPLFHLKQQISQILADDSKSEIDKEDEIYDSIKFYRKLLGFHIPGHCQSTKEEVPAATETISIMESLEHYTTTLKGINDIPQGDLNNLIAEPIKHCNASKEVD